MKQILYLAILCNMACAFQIKLTIMGGADLTAIKSQLTFAQVLKTMNERPWKVVEHRQELTDQEAYDALIMKTNKLIGFDGSKNFQVTWAIEKNVDKITTDKTPNIMMKQRNPSVFGFIDVELIKKNNIKAGILGGIGMPKINEKIESININDILLDEEKAKNARRKIEVSLEMHQKMEKLHCHFFEGALENLFGLYIGYGLNKKIDISVGAGLSLIEGKYTLVKQDKTRIWDIIRFKINKAWAMNLFLGENFI